MADADAIATAARRVRLAGGAVHELTSSSFDAANGHVYLTRCGCEITAQAGAMLTTRDADCHDCRGATMARAGLIRTAVAGA